MIIGVAGPYTAATAAERQENLDRMNKAARSCWRKDTFP